MTQQILTRKICQLGKCHNQSFHSDHLGEAEETYRSALALDRKQQTLQMVLLHPALICTSTWPMSESQLICVAANFAIPSCASPWQTCTLLPQNSELNWQLQRCEAAFPEKGANDFRRSLKQSMEAWIALVSRTPWMLEEPLQRAGVVAVMVSVVSRYNSPCFFNAFLQSTDRCIQEAASRFGASKPARV